jgi:hypothetical protein
MLIFVIIVKLDGQFIGVIHIRLLTDCQRHLYKHLLRYLLDNDVNIINRELLLFFVSCLVYAVFYHVKKIIIENFTGTYETNRVAWTMKEKNGYMYLFIFRFVFVVALPSSYRTIRKILSTNKSKEVEYCE